MTMRTLKRKTRRPKEASRLLKVCCASCGYIARTTRKWLDTLGAPLCPIDGHGAMEERTGDE